MQVSYHINLPLKVLLIFIILFIFGRHSIEYALQRRPHLKFEYLGDAINIEEAIAAHLSPYKMKSNCVHCFRKTGASVFPSPLNRYVGLHINISQYKCKCIIKNVNKCR